MTILKKFASFKRITISLFLVFSFMKMNIAQVEDQKMKEFAQKSVDNYLNNVIDKKKITTFGFKSVDELGKAKIGEPYQVFFIGLSKLKEYQTGQDLKSLLEDASKYWYPVMVQNTVRSKIEIIKKDDKLLAGEFGGSRTAQAIGGIQQKLSDILEAANIQKAEKVHIVQVPVLSAQFLYISNTDGDYFIPAMTNPQMFNLEEKVYKPDELFNVLKEFVEKIDPKTVR